MDGIAENWATLSTVSLLEQTMGATERIAKLIESLPEREVAEILDFAEFLAMRHQEESQPASTLTTVDSIAAFRGNGRGGSVERLLAERRADSQHE